MAFQVRPEEREKETVYHLQDGQGNGMEIWPAQGFNAYRWYVEHGGTQELLYTSPALFQENRPTRTGNPILFPFPNRIRDAQFTWEGKEYRLPTTDNNRRNAIHGFLCRLPWRVTDQGADANQAWITGEFQASRDGPDLLPLWPADYLARMTYHFFGTRWRLDIDIQNPDKHTLPFGLGFHPYFSLSGFGREEAVVGVPARKYWPLEENLPAAAPKEVAGMRDLRQGKEVGALRLDDVLTDLDTSDRNSEGLIRFGWVLDWQKRRRLDLFGSPAFREVVVFNPVHRQAFCIEPYTCVTDAVNLAAQGKDAGWQSLAPGQGWRGALEFVFQGIG